MMLYVFINRNLTTSSVSVPDNVHSPGGTENNPCLEGTHSLQEKQHGGDPGEPMGKGK